MHSENIIDTSRLKRPLIARFLERLDQLSNLDECPSDVTAQLAEWYRGGSEFSVCAPFFLGRSVSQVPVNDEFWVSNDADDSFAMPRAALLYYYPSIIKQAVLIPSSGPGDILSKFTPPARTQDRPERRKKYLLQLSDWPVGHLEVIRDLILLVLKEPVVFEFDQPDAKKCYDRFWFEVEHVKNLETYLNDELAKYG